MIRVTQQQLFTNFITNMNDTLSELMELNTQASSQKKINKPSDDPVGMARVLEYRTSLSEIDQYRVNINTAKGWLGLADETLTQVSNIITRARELAEQAATGTLTKDNREEISYEVRQLFEQLVNMSNTSYENKSIFAGQKVDTNAFVERLWVMANDSTLDGQSFSVSGSAETTVLIQFYDASTAAGGTNLQLNDADLRYRYSTDGGDTWTTGQTTTAAGSYRVIDAAGVSVTLDETLTVDTNDSSDTLDTSGTWFYVRPTAEYQGDDADGIDVAELGPDSVTGSAQGVFRNNVAVRIDNTVSNMSQTVEYSYSVDNGSTWTTGNSVTNPANSNAVTLTIPGGNLVLSSNGGNSLSAGMQFMVRPRTAGMDVTISANEKVQINSVGKEIFGGVYQDPSSNAAAAVFQSEPSKNLFEVMGKLVAYMETNSQDGIQQALADLKQSQINVMNNAARIAGRENRLEITDTVLQGLKLDESERLASIEDADVSELMTKLAQQQIAYQAVLKSSSLIMRLSLVNHL